MYFHFLGDEAVKYSARTTSQAYKLKSLDKMKKVEKIYKKKWQIDNSILCSKMHWGPTEDATNKLLETVAAFFKF